MQHRLAAGPGVVVDAVEVIDRAFGVTEDVTFDVTGKSAGFGDAAAGDADVVAVIGLVDGVLRRTGRGRRSIR
jgi:hypothetical protein